MFKFILMFSQPLPNCLLFIFRWLFYFLFILLQIFYLILKVVHFLNDGILMISQPNVLILRFLYTYKYTFKSPSTCFFILWYFWLESTIFLTSGSLDLLIIPHKLFPSLCFCFSFNNLIYIFIKWTCFNKFSIYSSSIFKLGFKPNTTAPLDSRVIPSK
jgi:hypothetical protein